jgi:hypothetical protein
MKAATHIIGRQNIHLRYNGARDPFALRQMISDICSDELPVRLAKLLDQYDDLDYVVRIDKLDVNLTLSDDGNLQERIAKAIIEKVEAELRQKLETRKHTQLLTANFARTLRIYLERGYLPRYTDLKNATEFRQALTQAWQQPTLRQQIIPEIVPVLRSNHARQRLLSLLSDAQLDSFVFATGIWTQSAWTKWQQAITSAAMSVSGQPQGLHPEVVLKSAVLETISQQPALPSASLVLATSILKTFKQQGIDLRKEEWLRLIPADARVDISTVIEELTVRGDSTSFIPPTRQHLDPPAPLGTGQEDQESPQNTYPDDAIFIRNAGLVLLALYLPAFFTRLGLLNDEGKITDFPKAIALLRYLVFASVDFEEMELPLEKLLCGIPLAQSIWDRPHITEAEKVQAEELLQSVIEHWTILKNTTPVGLRHSFLQREGKLSFRNNQWELTVHRQAHDILLDYLPWSINMIKLPWMPHLLVVKWIK